MSFEKPKRKPFRKLISEKQSVFATLSSRERVRLYFNDAFLKAFPLPKRVDILVGQKEHSGIIRIEIPEFEEATYAVTKMRSGGSVIVVAASVIGVPVTQSETDRPYKVSIPFAFVSARAVELDIRPLSNRVSQTQEQSKNDPSQTLAYRLDYKPSYEINKIIPYGSGS